MKRKSFLSAIFISFYFLSVAQSQCPMANAGPDKIICSGGSGVTIGGIAQTGGVYRWTPTTGLSNPNIAQPTANPTTTTTYTLTATTANLITNGDFESGNTGFSSDYAVYPSSMRPAEAHMEVIQLEL